MIPAFLITLREVIEASLIVATFAGILTKLGKREELKVLYSGATLAAVTSIAVIFSASFIGINVQRLYTGNVEAVTEGILYIFSSIFVTYAVFFLHNHFAGQRVRLIQQMHAALSTQERNGLFFLAFSLVLREGIEIALFLSTTFLSESPVAIIGGFALGLATGLVIATLMVIATIRIPVYVALRTTTVLIVLFAAGLLSQGVHELTEAGLLPVTHDVTIALLTHTQHGFNDVLKAVLGITPSMSASQLATYGAYVVYMWVYLSSAKKKLTFKA